MQLAIRQACKKIGADDNYELFVKVKDVLEDNPIFIGEIAVDKKDETKGFLITGRPGSGKTQLLSQVIETLYGNAKVVIHDYKADYLQAFYDPNGYDIVFNPLDARCVKWDIFEGVQG
jgi:Cdc6-like AAA superfamily ATPase